MTAKAPPRSAFVTFLLFISKAYRTESLLRTASPQRSSGSETGLRICRKRDRFPLLLVTRVHCGTESGGSVSGASAETAFRSRSSASPPGTCAPVSTSTPAAFGGAALPWLGGAEYARGRAAGSSALLIALLLSLPILTPSRGMADFGRFSLSSSAVPANIPAKISETCGRSSGSGPPCSGG